MITLETYYSELVNPMTYQEFKALTEELIAEGKTTGDEQTEQKINFTKLNQQRMKRVEKQFVGRKPNTTYHATDAGREAFKSHLDALEQLILNNRTGS